MAFGLNGKLKTLLDRLTTARAGNIDAAISSRAAETDAIDIKNNASSLLTKINNLSGSYGAVRNTRYGYNSTAVSTSTNYNNFSVAGLTDINKCLLDVNAYAYYSSSPYSRIGGYGYATSLTNVRIYLSAGSLGKLSHKVGFTLVELF
ncbi:MAG: hypothetical protein QM479_16075 [Pseudomonadota bacterium]